MRGVKKPDKLQMESTSRIPLINSISFLLQDGRKTTVAVIEILSNSPAEAM